MADAVKRVGPEGDWADVDDDALRNPSFRFQFNGVPTTAADLQGTLADVRDRRERQEAAGLIPPRPYRH